MSSFLIYQQAARKLAGFPISASQWADMLPGFGLRPSDRRSPYEARDLQHRRRPVRFRKLARAVERAVLVQVRGHEFPL